MATKTKSPALAIILLFLIVLAIILYLLFAPKANFSLRSGTDQTSPLEASREVGQADETPLGDFEFIKPPNYTPLDAFPFGEKAHIIVRAPGVQNSRPVTLTATRNGQKVWQAVIEDNQSNCADANACSIDGPDPDIDWDHLEARDQDGNLVATYQG
ncbi:MAG: hypothetical protein UX85_C0004G0197 [Candidatus Beckwithbacteria bacterium GW2011_GWB1_47_15]|uniref:Uncharacterized protein n=1 Tax=Candidatus Beckwithbacteria bacterium GW2011_GWB1_47_15 TaxID=1618371 RepID=A0A0G1UU77_9BACT|nr:MAG: hypothetical protein UY43_C0001G0038 [Candidatus Beckwithbacteria bacterium GW2011_GWC1_49_16]KKU34978.1 MAG: hypothetical protein UX50_C0007G0013 [Candidatus Beckwithbacteria bacterium GW2011_GWA1_46_30]KKU61275.1 MAG: hypothetical protein UX85_C0004G0197 [Candidatus Beckwithbacteria bacterium GW2011_GWB1_47_15]KKU71429.1 MAG: hypothetical protein UX97_C0006G0013 [Candidatus Beckwithbacteria bacterium GW2011_GWA2_47_25]KKW03083.1 MAG: hypothetical protein UY37_C0007G0037 [Candidatus Be